jgi:methyl-accepting chemotaxis protein
MTRKNADDSHAAAELMGGTSQVVNEANSTLEQMEASMNEINASSGKIAKIIKIIVLKNLQTRLMGELVGLPETWRLALRSNRAVPRIVRFL